MKDSDLRKSWGEIASKIGSSPKEDIEAILKRKTKKVTDSFLLASIVGMIVFSLACVALIYAMIHRWDDGFYRVNAIFLCVYCAYRLFNSITSYYRIRYIGPNMPLKEWLKRWVKYKEEYVDGFKLERLVSIPLLITALYLAIYLFVTNESLSELLSHPTFSISFLVALITSRIVAVMVRKRKQVKQLQHLKDMYDEMNSQDE